MNSAAASLSSAAQPSKREQNADNLTTENIKSAGLALPQKPINKRYQIIERIGSGGMGVVFRARDLLLRREVALKILTQDASKALGEADAYEIYLNEAHVAASLGHPNIVCIHDFGQVEESQDKNPFLVMELIEGKPLIDAVKAQAFSSIEIIKIFIQVCDALAYAHSKEKPILHRDIKPENILIKPDGHAVLIDFGLSRFMGNASTTMDIFKGSFRTTAPEIILAFFKQKAADYTNALNPKMDLYSLGATFYMATTGTLPVPGKSLPELHQNLPTHQITPPKQLVPTTPQTLSDILMKMLAFKPEDRPASVQEVEDELCTLLEELSASDETQDEQAAFEAADFDSVHTSGKSFTDDVFNESKFDGIDELKVFRKSDEVKKPKAQTPEAVAPTAKARNRKTPQSALPKSTVNKPLIGTAVAAIVLLSMYGGSLLSSKSKEKASTTDKYEATNPAASPENHAEKVMKSMVENIDNQNRRPNGSRISNEQTEGRRPTRSRSNFQLASAATAETFGDDIVVYSRNSENTKNTTVYNVTLGTIIKDAVLTHKLVSYNIASPVRVELRTPFKLDNEVVLPTKTLFIGQAEVLPTKDRVHVKFFKIVTPNHQEINFKGLALMADGSNGLVGAVEYPKGRSPGILAGSDVIGETGRVAINSLQPQTLGGQMGQVLASSSLTAAQRQLANSAADLPIITVDAFTPLQIFVEESF